MIPAMNIVAWSQTAPWAEQRQVEQDLIVSRALVALFSDDFLREQLRFRGGTALNKLHFPKPLRYSEDIDLVRTTEGPIGPVLDHVREMLTPWLGQPAFAQSDISPKMRFRVDAEDGTQIRLKVEINTRERVVYDAPISMPFSVQNPWFTGAADIPTFTNEELLATKLRALLQRRKGRDLIDLSHALKVFGDLNAKKTVEILGHYLEATDDSIPRAEAEKRMFAKLGVVSFLADVRPLLTAQEADGFDNAAAMQAFMDVFDGFIPYFPGQSWAKTPEMREKYGLRDVAE
jgi:predicted nucleotidyltransferase component of viral defense system